MKEPHFHRGRTIATALLLLLLPTAGGCFQWLPSGEAPRGAIVTNPVPETPLCEDELIQQLSNLLAATALSDFPGAGIALDCDAGSRTAAALALRNAGKVAGLRLQPDSELRLQGRTAGTSRAFSLIRGKKILWNKNFFLKQ